jgi:hypothetical protein
MEVNRKSVHSMPEFQSALSERSADPLLLRVNRGGHTLFVAIPK